MTPGTRFAEEILGRCGQFALVQIDRHLNKLIVSWRISGNVETLVVLDFEIVDDELHDLVTVSVYFQRSLLVPGSPLNVDDVERDFGFLGPEPRIMFENFEAGSEANDEIGASNALSSSLPIIRIAITQLFAKVDDRVP